MSGRETITLKLAESSRFGREGESVTLSLTPADVHDPTEMPTYFAGYKPDDYHGADVAPIVLVDYSEDYYRTAKSDNAFRRVNVKGSLQGAIPEVDPESELTRYKTTPRFIGSFVPAPTERQAGASLLKPRQAATRRCINVLSLDHEIDVWTKLVATASWSSSSFYETLTAGMQWNGGASSDPIGDIQDRMLASFQAGTDLWLDEQGWFDFFGNSKVKDAVQLWLGDGDKSRIVDSTAVKLPMLRNCTLHCAPARVVNETTLALGSILGDNCVLTCSPPGTPVDGETISTIKTFREKGIANVGYEVREYWVDGRGPEGGTMIVVYTYDTIVMTGPKCGGLIKDLHQ
jgi:hypothetical protein